MASGSIRIGTCSWNDYQHGGGERYPPEIASCGRLELYARHFDTVEIDSSYYRIPSIDTVKGWGERTPPGFLFHAKAYGAMTGHPINPEYLPSRFRSALPARRREDGLVQVEDPALLRALAEGFVAALTPLKITGKLGFIIFQFPPWFKRNRTNFDYLLHCREMTGGHPIAVEFRHGSWLDQRHEEETFAHLREHNITYVCCDEPQFGTLKTVPFRPRVTTSIGYLRLHGRDAEGWAAGELSRESYRYGEGELRQFAKVSSIMARETRKIFVMFINCHRGNAIANALRLKALCA